MPSALQKAALARLQGQIRAALPPSLGTTLGGKTQARSQIRAVIPTGMEVVDRFLFGCGGFPRGRMAEMYGDVGAGKTSFAMMVAGMNQKAGGIVQWVDSESGFDEDRAEVFGLDPEGVLLTEPTLESPLEEVIDAMRVALVASKPEDQLLIVWDSIATSPNKEEMEKDASTEVSMNRGKQIGRACRALALLAADRQATLLFVNQTREKIGTSYGSPITTPGGKGPKFAASIRLHLAGGTKVYKGDEVIGVDMLFKVDKNRFAPPFREARVRLLYETGWDNQWTLCNFAKDDGTLKKNAAVTQANADKARKALGWL